jgi:hypothetical protein
VHEGKALIERRRIYYIGGGVRHWFFTRDRGVAKSSGVRADARLNFIDGGVSFDSGVRRHGSIAASLFVGF